MSGEARSPVAAWFRSSRRMLAAELRQGGWLNFGAFRWSERIRVSLAAVASYGPDCSVLRGDAHGAAR